MRKKYDHRLVKSYRSYKVGDICRLFRDKKLHEQTIRKWVNSGKLKAIINGKTIYIYGAILKQFLFDNNKNSSRILQFNQFRCGKCKTIAEPINLTITNLTFGRGGSLKAFAHCLKCNHITNRHYKASELEKIRNLFTVLHSEVSRLSDSLCSTSKTHIIDEQHIGLSESAKNKPPDRTSKSSSSSNKTNVKQMSFF